MNKRVMLLWVVLFAFASAALAAADLEVNTPAISALQSSMQARHNKLAAYYASGAVGLTRDGNVAVRDASLAPLAERQNMTGSVADENRDRAALYREIARANNHPEWEAEVRGTFAQRWVDKAAGGWWVQNAGGAWIKK